MITLDFITALFYEIDEQMGAIPKHPVVYLHPADKYPRLTHRPSQEQKGLYERALMAS